jgi:hypothetical protein
MGSIVILAPDTSGLRICQRHTSHLVQRHAVGRARGDTRCSSSRPSLRTGTTRIDLHVTARGEQYAHSSKDDRSIDVSERQGITARGASVARASQRLLKYHRLSTSCKIGKLYGLSSLCSSACLEVEVTGSREVCLALCTAPCMQCQIFLHQAQLGLRARCESELTRNRR